jgi:hypothetical protein
MSKHIKHKYLDVLIQRSARAEIVKELIPDEEASRIASDANRAANAIKPIRQRHGGSQPTAQSPNHDPEADAIGHLTTKHRERNISARVS